jgi:hypothetical protein
MPNCNWFVLSNQIERVIDGIRRAPGASHFGPFQKGSRLSIIPGA